MKDLNVTIDGVTVMCCTLEQHLPQMVTIATMSQLFQVEIYMIYNSQNILCGTNPC